MLLNKPAIVLCSSGSSLYSDSCTSISRIALLARSTRSSPEYSGQGFSRHIRPYATVQGQYRGAGYQATRNKHLSSAQWPSSTNPTPYEIFSQSTHAPYNKARFFELVKLYHPDRHHQTSHDGLSHHTKLERYRLVIAANDILSDPAQRRLYNLYGIGWDGEPDVQSSDRSAGRAWRREPGNASMNATWEDWEQWYQKRDGQKQEPQFMSNGRFAGVLALFVIIAAWGQATRAGKNSMDLIDMQDQRDDAISQNMRRRQGQTFGMTREGRVAIFLRSRGHDHLLPDHVVHSSQNTDK